MTYIPEPGCKPADCNNCIHYFITHEANFRYGCHALGFKSRRMPVLDVIEASGQQCHFFKKKARDTA